MLKNLFPRLFGQFREGGIIRVRFVTGGGGGATATFSLKSAQGTADYQGLTLVRTGVGLFTLTLPGGGRNLALLGPGLLLTGVATLIGGTMSPTGQGAVTLGSNATIALQIIPSAGGAAPDTIAVGDEVHFVLLVDR